MQRDVSITKLVVSPSEGNAAALEDLTPRVQRELHALAKNYLRRCSPNQTLQPTARVNDAWLHLPGPSPSPRWENRAHFFGIAARLMRLILADYARAQQAVKRLRWGCHFLPLSGISNWGRPGSGSFPIPRTGHER